jgi:hypothetical protein
MWLQSLLLSLCGIMDHLTLKLYGHLRLLVGYLGEKDQGNWWATTFFSSPSRYFLEPVFARTTRLAQYNGVREAARRLHDEQIGTGNVFHLFRLPEEVEQDLQHLMNGAPDEWFAEVNSQESALTALRNLAGETISVTPGPRSIGSVEEFYRSLGSKTLAQHYLAAFEQGVRTFPYFVD